MKKISWDSMAEAMSDEERAWNRRIQEGRSEAIAFLGLARKPSGRVRARLSDEGFDETIIREVIKQLQEEGYLDDTLLARKLVAQRQHRRGESRFALRQRLLTRGLAHEAVDAALSEAPTDQDQAACLLAARFSLEMDQLSCAQTPIEEKERLGQRLMRFLAGRGFDSDIIYGLLERIRDGTDERD